MLPDLTKGENGFPDFSAYFPGPDFLSTDPRLSYFPVPIPSTKLLHCVYKFRHTVKESAFENMFFTTSCFANYLYIDQRDDSR